RRLGAAGGGRRRRQRRDGQLRDEEHQPDDAHRRRRRGRGGGGAPPPALRGGVARRAQTGLAGAPMASPTLALLWASAYTLLMSQKAMLRKALGGDDELVRTMAKEWAVGLADRMHIQVRAHGMGAIDWSRPCVVMANHQSYLDVMALYHTLPRAFGFVAKKQ